MNTTANNLQKVELKELTQRTDEIAQALGLTVDHMTTWGKRNFYYYRDQDGNDIRNAKGEKIVIEISHCEDYGGKNTLPALWFKAGWTPELLTTFWSLHTYIKDEQGNGYGCYNCQEKLDHTKKRMVINFDWMEKATEESFEKLLRETLRRFMAA